MEKLILSCPIRGILKASGKSSDGLTPSEEALRVEAIRYLLKEGYPKENFLIEPIIKRFGHGGRNSFRADFAVLDSSANRVNSHDTDELLHHCVLLGEVKKDNGTFDYVRHTQVEPLLDFADLTVPLRYTGIMLYIEYFGKSGLKENVLVVMAHYHYYPSLAIKLILLI